MAQTGNNLFNFQESYKRVWISFPDARLLDKIKIIRFVGYFRQKLEKEISGEE
jgi:hypothetical protein